MCGLLLSSPQDNSAYFSRCVILAVSNSVPGVTTTPRHDCCYTAPPLFKLKVSPKTMPTRQQCSPKAG